MNNSEDDGYRTMHSFNIRGQRVHLISEYEGPHLRTEFSSPTTVSLTR